MQKQVEYAEAVRTKYPEAKVTFSRFCAGTGPVLPAVNS